MFRTVDIGGLGRNRERTLCAVLFGSAMRTFATLLRAHSYELEVPRPLRRVEDKVAGAVAGGVRFPVSSVPSSWQANKKLKAPVVARCPNGSLDQQAYAGTVPVSSKNATIKQKTKQFQANIHSSPCLKRTPTGINTMDSGRRGLLGWCGGQDCFGHEGNARLRCGAVRMGSPAVNSPVALFLACLASFRSGDLG